MSPVQSWGHVQYWENSSTVVTPVSNAVPGYPAWEAAPMSQVLGFGFGGAVPLLEKWGASLQWFWRLLRIVLTWDRPRRRALEKAIETLNHDLYKHALLAVKMTAHEPGMNGPAAWKSLAHKLNTRSTWAENQWRHLHACSELERMIRADGSTISNSDRAVMVEIAYQSMAQHAVGSTKA